MEIELRNDFEEIMLKEMQAIKELAEAGVGKPCVLSEYSTTQLKEELRRRKRRDSMRHVREKHRK